MSATLVVCSVVLATGIWDCGNPLPVNDAVSMAISANMVMPFDAKTSKRSPYTIFLPNELPEPHR